MKKGERRQTVLENLIYLIIWFTLFSAPVLDQYYNQEHSFNWSDILRAWKILAPFFSLFILNNYILTPFLFIRKRFWLYIVFILGSIGLVYLLSSQPAFPDRQNRPLVEEKRGNHPLSHPYKEHFPPPKDRHPEDNRSPTKRMQENVHPPFLRQWIPLSPLFHFSFMAILLIGFNLAIKLLFKSLRDDQRVKELEKQTLQTELDYLKHQINPHFFMNTLNNIHALIDIDTEKAKSTVLEFSQMMRYILYDTAQTTLPLKREIHFLIHYIELMKIRYTDQVDIRVCMPTEDLPDVKIPPLLFISFIENAFKHGISYQKKSFVHVSMDIKENEIRCLIINSIFDNANEQQQGIGLENVRKRLQLLYGENYTLSIQAEENEYQVLLIIPLQV